MDCKVSYCWKINVLQGGNEKILVLIHFPKCILKSFLYGLSIGYCKYILCRLIGLKKHINIQIVINTSICINFDLCLNIYTQLIKIYSATDLGFNLLIRLPKSYLIQDCIYRASVKNTISSST